jgi:hypothetical protein
MKSTFLFVLTMVSFSVLHSQNLENVDKAIQNKPKIEVDTTGSWKFSGIYSASAALTSLTNWAAGGNNNLNTNVLARQFAVKQVKNWTWFNLLEANLGYNFQDVGTLKTDDKLEFTTRLDRNLKESKWSISVFGNFRTQFMDGFANVADDERISTFMAPGFLTYGLGMTNASFKGFSVYVSPVQAKHTFVFDSTLFANDAFFNKTIPNVTAGNIGGSRIEMGAFIDIIYKNTFAKKIELNSRINLFSNYLDRPQNIDVNWENIFLFKLVKNLSLSIQTHLIYDDDILVRARSNSPTPDVIDAPGTQFRFITGVGIAYSFGGAK